VEGPPHPYNAAGLEDDEEAMNKIHPLCQQGIRKDSIVVSTSEEMENDDLPNHTKGATT